jgi:hypothetical protein
MRQNFKGHVLQKIHLGVPYWCPCMGEMIIIFHHNRTRKWSYNWYLSHTYFDIKLGHLQSVIYGTCGYIPSIINGWPTYGESRLFGIRETDIIRKTWCKINKGNAKRGISPRLTIWPGDLDLWPWKSIGFQILLRIKHVSSLVKIHWRMLILECSQGCYVVNIWTSDLDLWPWKSIGFQILLRTKYVPSLVKIHWRMLILVFTRMLRGKKFDSVTLTFDLENQ